MLVDVIIPVYKPDKTFFELIEKLESQTVPVSKIIIMNTEEKYFEQLVYGTKFAEKHGDVVVCHLSKREFDHAATRNKGVQKSDADVFVMMTQDAIPKDDKLIERLVKALEEPKIATAYARQLPKEDCHPVERYMRQFNYPEESANKSLGDVDRLGIKAFFCSNVCCAYKKSVYEELGGFVKHTIFNEDMIYAATALKAGYEIAYVADAEVFHSHNYTCAEQFHRNFDLGVSQAQNPEVFSNISSEGEGTKMVKQTLQYLKENKMRKEMVYLILQSGFKYLGYLLGKHYRKLPHGLVIKCSMNKEYWAQEERRRAVSGIDPTRGYGKGETE